MAPDGLEASAASSGQEIKAMVELQFALGEGPTTDAFGSGRPVLVSDLAASDGRWVVFTPAALALGVSGVYALPLGLGAIRLGVLTCYTEQKRVLTSDELRQCLVAAEAATELLLTTDAGDGPVVPHPDVQASLHIRSEVYQAQGMLMVELGIDLADALAQLRAIAFAEDIDLNQLATDLVTGRRRFPERNEDA